MTMFYIQVWELMLFVSVLFLFYKNKRLMLLIIIIIKQTLDVCVASVLFCLYLITCVCLKNTLFTVS